MGQHDREQKALALAFGIAVAAAAAAVFSALRSGHGTSEVVRSDGVRAVEDDLRVDSELVVLEVETAARTTASAPVDAGEEPAIASAEPAGTSTSAFGIILDGRTFPTSQWVQAWPVNQDGGSDAERGVDGTCSGDEWTVAGLTAGPWMFVVRAASGPRLAYGVSKEVVIIAGIENGPFTVVLDEYFVEGSVTDSNGAPICDLPISFQQTSTKDRAWRTVLGTHVAASDEPAPDVLEDSPADAKAALAMFRGAQPHGSSNQLLAVSRALQFLETGTSQGDGDILRTDSSGNYHIAVDGPSRVRVNAPRWNRGIREGRSWIMQVLSADLKPVEPTAIRNFVLLRSATLTGRITRTDGGTCLGVTVFVRRLSGGAIRTAVSAEEGAYIVHELAPGPYLVFARAGGAAGRDVSTHGQVQLTEGDTTRADLTLELSGTIVGQVVDGDGNAALNVEVVAYGTNDRDVARKEISDASGRFEIPGMYPCRYEIEVSGWRVRGPVFVDVVAGPGSVDAGTIVIDPVVIDPVVTDH